MTPEQLAAIVARHRPYKPDAPWSTRESCTWCKRGWPCDTVQVLVLLRETREAAQAFLAAAALEAMTKAPGYIAAKRRFRVVLAASPEPVKRP